MHVPQIFNYAHGSEGNRYHHDESIMAIVDKHKTARLQRHFSYYALLILCSVFDAKQNDAFPYSFAKCFL